MVREFTPEDWKVIEAAAQRLWDAMKAERDAGMVDAKYFYVPSTAELGATDVEAFVEENAAIDAAVARGDTKPIPDHL